MSAAVEAGRAGAGVVVVDENTLAGGQLFKQIHKFFGSRAHLAGVRGCDIGVQLLQDVKAMNNVDVWLDSVVYGIFDGNILSVMRSGHAEEIQADRLIIATGASENPVQFPGWTLPGVMGAGAAQTMANVHRVLPGKRIIMVGSGNVGIIVSYQLLQAGADVLAIVEALPRIGGYAVHAAKVRRAGVPIFLSHTVLRAHGATHVEGVTIGAVDEGFRPIPGSEKYFEADTVCVAAGLTPLAELAWLMQCRMEFCPTLGGFLPIHDDNMRTSCPGVYVAGDVTGVEEASTAMEEGRLAGIAAAESLGCIGQDTASRMKAEVWSRLNSLRQGPFGTGRRTAKQAILQQSRERVS